MDLTPETFFALTEWFKSDLGQAVCAAEKYQLEQVLSDYFGYHSLQLAGEPQLLQSNESPINHRIWLVPGQVDDNGLSTIHSDCSLLPFRENSLDLILLPHVLEFIEDPQNLLSEVRRVLIPEGRVIIFGFNPSSLWGGAHLFHRKKHMPWVGKFHGITHLRYWLQYQHLSEEKMQTFFFSLPSQNAKRRHQCRFLEALGRMCWPWLGGLYMIIAHKQVSTLTPVHFKKRKLHFSPTKKMVTPTATRYEHD